MSLTSCSTSCNGEPLIAVLNLRGRLENSVEPDERLWIASTAACPSRISSAAMPATGEPRMTRGVSPQASVVDRPTASSRRQISGHVLDPDPVQLDVLPVGDVGGVPGELRGDLRDHPQLLGRELAAVDADPQHEVLVVELVRLEDRGLAAVDAGAPLGVEAPPAQSASAGRPGRCGRSRPWSRCSLTRARTLSPSSSFLTRSLGVSGSRWPSAHCP
jgi:hypothetical protein